MTFQQHELLVELFRNRPALVVDLLTEVLNRPVPPFSDARLESAEFVDITPTQYRADAVVVLGDEKPVLAVVVEAQLTADGDKQWSWPVYLASLRARMRCPAMLLIVCVDAALARRCARPIDLGHPDFILAPIVLGPDQVPAVYEPDLAIRAPELAILSALAHGGAPGGDKVLDVLWDGLSAVSATDQGRARLYVDFVLAALPEAARTHMESVMLADKQKYRSDFARQFFGEGKAEGKVEGKAEFVLAVLAARDINISPDAQELILNCPDLAQLDRWIRRAANATSLSDLFN